jgi:hypothetical protein
MVARSTDIMILLGAGASAEAGVPVSAEMIGKVESYLRDSSDWMPFLDLYNHVKASIFYSAGLKGRFTDGRSTSVAAYNVEVLVNTLYELERNEDHPLYPFIASWNSRFVALAGADFSQVFALRRLIVTALKKWMCLDDPSKADYYSGLVKLQQGLNFPLNIFSLNYDLCVERLEKSGIKVETGFAGFGPNYPWDWERYDDSFNELPELYLYKLHGSINWKRDRDSKELFSLEQIQSIDDDEIDIIFGRDFKLEAADPYLFFAYQLRQSTLRSKLIVIVGYGFGDLHINKLLTQSVRKDSERKLVIVQRCTEKAVDSKRREIGERLELSNQHLSQLIIKPGTASEFLSSPALAEELTALIPETDPVPF